MITIPQGQDRVTRQTYMNEGTSNLGRYRQFFLQHLLRTAAANKVRIARTLRDSSGKVVLAAGECPTQQEQLAQCGLPAILAAIEIVPPLDAQSVVERLRALLQRYDGPEQLSEVHQLETLIHDGMLSLQQFPQLANLVALFTLVYPDAADHCLLNAWWACGIAAQLHQGHWDPRLAFLAALACDVGFLLLPPNVAHFSGELDPSIWKIAQEHTGLGEKLLEGIDGLPKIVARAVAEHHERTDGGGYPGALVEEKISQLGELVALADALCGHTDTEAATERNSILRVMPFLRLNPHTFSAPLHQAAGAFLHACPAPEPPQISNAECAARVEQQLRQHAALTGQLAALHLLCQALQPLRGNLADTCRRIAARIVKINHSSGVLDAAIARWMQHVIDHQLNTAYAEMNEIGLMLEEMDWRFNDFGRCLNRLLQSVSNPELRQRLAQESASLLAMEPQRAAPDLLSCHHKLHAF